MKIETEASLTDFIDNPPWLLHVFSDLLNSSRPEAFVDKFVWPDIGGHRFCKACPYLFVVEHDNRRSLPRNKTRAETIVTPPGRLAYEPDRLAWKNTGRFQFVLREAGESPFARATIRSKTGLASAILPEKALPSLPSTQGFPSSPLRVVFISTNRRFGNS